VSTRAQIVELPHAGVQRQVTSSLGMVVFLASWTMMFASLFFAYGLLRFRADVWPPASVPPLPVGRPLFNTIALALSSASLYFALHSIRRGRRSFTSPALLLSALLAVAFLALQIHVWAELWRAGLVPSSGQYASVFYLLTVFHGLHVAVGVVALFWLAIRALTGAYTPARHLPVSTWSYYWHFVGAVWLLMYVLVYLV